MFTTSQLVAANAGLSRRSLLGMAAVASLPMLGSAHAEPAHAGATATITQFNAALVAAMKAGGHTGFNQRFDALAPAVDQAFDLPAVLAVSVGLGWTNLSPDQQARLLSAFRRYTVASYVANFDNYAGQTFSVAPETRRLDADQVVVQSHIIPANGQPTELDYVMRQTSSGWKIVDVLAAGSISRVAVQRSDFRRLLARGGPQALAESLRSKSADLSDGQS